MTAIAVRSGRPRAHRGRPRRGPDVDTIAPMSPDYAETSPHGAATAAAPSGGNRSDRERPPGDEAVGADDDHLAGPAGEAGDGGGEGDLGGGGGREPAGAAAEPVDAVAGHRGDE